MPESISQPSIPDFSKLLDAHLLDKNRAEGERPISGNCTWRASKLGSCLRAQYLEFFLKRPKIVEMDALSLRRFEVGHQWGRQFGDWFEDLGFDVYEEKELYDPVLDIGGHADFILKRDSLTLGIELKSVNSKWFWYRAKEAGSKRPMFIGETDDTLRMNSPPSVATTASPEHMMQAAVYSLLTDNKFPWIVLTVSKDDLTMEQDVVTDEHRELATARIERLNAIKEFPELLPECECLHGWGWKYCPYYQGDVKEARKKGAKPQGDCCVI